MPKPRTVVAKKKSKSVASKAKRPDARGASASTEQEASVPTQESSLSEVTREVRTLADTMLRRAASAATWGLRDAKGGQKARKKKSSVSRVLTGARAIGAAAKAADSLRSLGTRRAAPSTRSAVGKKMRELREQAGMTLSELGKAVNLKDPELLAAAEQGRATLPFEIIMRVSAVLGRKDPLTALMTLTRSSYPKVWETLESMGIGRLVLQSAREREFVNVLVAEDRARALNDREFSELLAFVKAAIGIALAFNERVAERVADKKEPATS